MMTSNASRFGLTGAALVLLSLGAFGAAACGSDGSNAVSGPGSSGGTGDGGGTGEGGTGDGGSGGNTDGGSSRGDGGPAVAANGVNLGSAADFVILAKTGITNVPTSMITGNLGVSPVTHTAITGLPLTPDPGTGAFATSPEVKGKIYASDYSVPTPDNLTVAIGAMMTAFTDAAGRAPKATELGAGDIGSMTLSGGVYKWGTGLLIPTNVTLEGSSTDVWIFQIAQNLTVRSAVQVILTGGALAKNVFWQVAGAADLDTTSHLEGTILSQTLISLKTGASINGRLLAQTAVTISGSAVITTP